MPKKTPSNSKSNLKGDNSKSSTSAKKNKSKSKRSENDLSSKSSKSLKSPSSSTKTLAKKNKNKGKSKRNKSAINEDDETDDQDQDERRPSSGGGNSANDPCQNIAQQVCQINQACLSWGYVWCPCHNRFEWKRITTMKNIGCCVMPCPPNPNNQNAGPSNNSNYNTGNNYNQQTSPSKKRRKPESSSSSEQTSRTNSEKSLKKKKSKHGKKDKNKKKHKSGKKSLTNSPTSSENLANSKKRSSSELVAHQPKQSTEVTQTAATEGTETLPEASRNSVTSKMSTNSNCVPLPPKCIVNSSSQGFKHLDTTPAKSNYSTENKNLKRDNSNFYHNIHHHPQHKHQKPRKSSGLSLSDLPSDERSLSIGRRVRKHRAYSEYFNQHDLNNGFENDDTIYDCTLVPVKVSTMSKTSSEDYCDDDGILRHRSSNKTKKSSRGQTKSSRSRARSPTRNHAKRKRIPIQHRYSSKGRRKNVLCYGADVSIASFEKPGVKRFLEDDKEDQEIIMLEVHIPLPTFEKGTRVPAYLHALEIRVENPGKRFQGVHSPQQVQVTTDSSMKR